MRKNLLNLLLMIVAGSLICTSASATTITYSLSDKAPGAENPPDYGLRIDGLFGEESSIWTFSFNSTDVKMEIDTVAETAHVFGEVIGAKDVGSEWAPATGYSWELDFTYTDITINDAVTGYWSAADVGATPTGHVNTANKGSLKLLSDADVDGIVGSDLGRYVGFADYKGGDFYLDGSKGPYVSAWLASTLGFVDDPGTLVLGDYERFGACCKDFGYKATLVPEPDMAVLFVIALFGLGVSRRLSTAY